MNYPDKYDFEFDLVDSVVGPRKIRFFAVYIMIFTLYTVVCIGLAEIVRTPSNHIILELPPLPEATPLPKELDPEIVDCLAKNIYFESRNQSFVDKIAVGYVPLNRLAKPRWAKRAKNVCDIINQRAQFSWKWDGKPDVHEKHEIREWFESLMIAEEVLRGNVLDPTEGADHYHAQYVNPAWKSHYTFVAQFDDHLFYNSTE